MKAKFAWLFILFPLFSPLLFAQSFNDSINNQDDIWELAGRLTAAMSDEQALGQTFMLGWVGAEPSPLLMDWIRERNIGGVKIFGWNTDDTRRLAETVGELQQAAMQTQFGIPLLVATDQEGGLVRHVKGSTSETPGNMAIGASGIPMDAYFSGYYIGKEMALLGINMNFAPAVDLYTNRDSTLIGPRSFGPDPVQAGIMGAAFARGHRETGVIPTAKHFPGHGDTALDSHGVLPRINVPFGVLWERELVPYRLLVREGIPAIMSGHLAFPNTAGGQTPASLSQWFLTELLRKQMGFNGLIITDDLMMVGATVYTGSLSQAAKQALVAGNDIIMFSQTPVLNDAIWTLLANSMRTEPEFRERVRDACRRILALKLEHLRGEKAVPYIPDLARIDRGIVDPEGAAFFLSLAARSVTVINDNDVLPLTPENAGRVLLAGNFTDFFEAGRRAFPAAVSHWHNPQRSLELLALARNADTVIFCLSSRAGIGMLQQLRALGSQGSTGRRLIVFSVLNPVFLEELGWADASVVVYSYAPESFIAGFSAILGRIPGSGSLPFSLSGRGGRE
ncbi:MAG: glycoside hydrolase family 3 protein [Treponema sp.]|nr:glycoside hydrolase family 3 protein [Treponema sp.]